MDDDQRERPADDLHTFAEDRFEEEQLLGEGSNALVQAVYDRELGRVVALKLSIEDAVRRTLAGVGDSGVHEYVQSLERGGISGYTLLREALLLAQVNHPAVVSVLEVGRFEDGAVGMIMPLLEGGVSGYDSRVSWRYTLEQVLHLAGGVAALHRAGIVHRDLKPGNILFDEEDRPCIADLGLACHLDDEEFRCHVAGSRPWMAPELLEDQPATPSSDQFALCMIAFEMFYGHAPFAPFASSWAKLAGEVSEIRRDDVPKELRALLVRGLAPKPEDRWASVGELRAALTTFATREQRPRRTRSWWTAAGLGAGLAAVCSVGMCVTMSEAQADACEEVSRELGDFWDEEVQAELRVVLGVRRATDALQSWAARWAEVRAKECERDRRADRELRASPCSASLRRSFVATIDTLQTPHLRDGLKANELIATLPPPEYCLEHPDDDDYGFSGISELRALDLELLGLFAAGELEVAERRQAQYMAAARKLNSKYDVARAIYWRGELRLQRGELDDAERDFKRVEAEATRLDARRLEAEALTKLVAVAGGQGRFEAAETYAVTARSAWLVANPDQLAELQRVLGLAFVEGDERLRERGVLLLRDAVEMREAQYSHYGGSRAMVGRAMESLARGLLRKHEADEALDYAKRSLAIHELEYSGRSERAHVLLRLVFVGQVKTSRMLDAHKTLRLLRDPFFDRGEVRAYVEETVWAATMFHQAGKPEYARMELTAAAGVAQENDLDEEAANIEALMTEWERGP